MGCDIGAMFEFRPACNQSILILGVSRDDATGICKNVLKMLLLMNEKVASAT
jgi:hypothetical protein